MKNQRPSFADVSLNVRLKSSQINLCLRVYNDNRNDFMILNIILFSFPCQLIANLYLQIIILPTDIQLRQIVRVMCSPLTFANSGNTWRRCSYMTSICVTFKLLKPSIHCLCTSKSLDKAQSMAIAQIAHLLQSSLPSYANGVLKLS